MFGTEYEFDISEQGIAAKFLQKAENSLVIIADERKDCIFLLEKTNKLYSDLLEAFDVGWHWWHFSQKQFLPRFVDKYWTL
jgi:hypothetical protein